MKNAFYALVYVVLGLIIVAAFAIAITPFQNL